MKFSISTAPPEAPKLTQLAEHGFFLCRACQRIASPTEETAGEPWAKCDRCGSAGTLVFHPPELPQTH